ncbi:MAG TPA: hypothetical protein VFP84_31110 [Kofleriaceae bacterium]|nr:hypothetical protein [Kofleriaceae bacterium]
MSITTAAFRFTLTAAALCAAATPASSKPRRVVIRSFDGPVQYAESGRSSVASILTEQYEVVPAAKWDDARATAARHSHGPEQWMRAAKQSGVGAIIEGIVQEEGRRKILNVTVREADNGKEFDAIQIRMDARAGLSTEATRQLQSELDKVLYWIDADHNEAAPVYQPVAPVTGSKRIGSTKAVGADDAGEETVAPRRGRRDARRAERDVRDGDVPDVRDVRALGGEAESDDARDIHDAKPTTVAAAEPANAPEVHDLSVLFPADSAEQKELNPHAFHTPRTTPRIFVDGGMYMGTRSLQFNGTPDSNLQQFEGVASKGFQLNVAAYPWPSQKMDGVMSGLGFTGSIHRSIASSVDFDNGDQIDNYVVNQNGWELGIHYRMPLSNIVSVDGGAFYGNQTYEIEDASPDFEIPDTKYSYLGAGAHLDLNITDRATVGFGARYFTVLDTGDLASTDWFGPTSASGLGLEATFTIPLPKNLYVRGELAYQRISLEMSGGGVITDQEQVTNATDATIIGNVNLGVAF